MYPVLFKIWGIPIHSYYVIWALALSAGLAGTRSRSVKIYGLDDEVVRRTLILAFVGMLLGARIGGYFDHWSYYVQNPGDILNPLKGALSSTTAFLGAGLSAIFYCRKRHLRVSQLAEAASLPAALTVAFGRLGCFMNGCCLGVTTDHFLGVSFPGDKGLVFRHPVQLYYSAGAIMIFVFLFIAEKKINGIYNPYRRSSVLWPLFMIFYGLMRFSLDFLREGDRIAGLRTAQLVGIGVIIVGVVWISVSIKHNRAFFIRPLS
jgi:phosphatidylglycerol:prolipoprotein diacylglycerol transferase